jgi:hypothetical protein
MDGTPPAFIGLTHDTGRTDILFTGMPIARRMPVGVSVWARRALRPVGAKLGANGLRGYLTPLILRTVTVPATQNRAKVMNRNV